MNGSQLAATPPSGFEDFGRELQSLFGEGVTTSPLNDRSEFGRRIHGIDLTRPLNAAQARMLQALLDRFSIITFPGQGDDSFLCGHLERLANHFGAPIPHPKNYANYIAHMKDKVPLELPPVDQRTSTRCNQAFPNEIRCIEGADSPAVYIVTNLVGSGRDREEQLASGLHWHTDIEFEPVPLSTSLFYVQRVPSTRDATNGNWVPDVHPQSGFYHPDSGDELMRRRLCLPLNGQTAYADTAAAFADLPPQRQRELEALKVRRRLRKGDTGWLAPLVYENPRTGRRSLHSPIWASRGKNIAPVTIDGFTDSASREFLDSLEEHLLDPKYRYDHAHAPGDITIWSNFATLHNAPPAKSTINRPEDARLMYRISCKGDPNFDLPRGDGDAWLAENIVPPYRTPLSDVGAGQS